MIDNDKEMGVAIRRCLEVREFEDGDPNVLTNKLGEEFGEFCEAVLKETGHLRHKELKENSFGEAADIFNTVLSVLGKLHPHMSVEELMYALIQYVNLKREKYERIVKEHY